MAHMANHSRKRSRGIALVLLTAGTLLVGAAGCERTRVASEDIGGGGTYYQSDGHSWGSGPTFSSGYISHGSISRGGFGGGGYGGS